VKEEPAVVPNGGRRVQFEMFFTLPDFSDVSLRDYQETMQRPFFSLSKKRLRAAHSQFFTMPNLMLPSGTCVAEGFLFAGPDIGEERNGHAAVAHSLPLSRKRGSSYAGKQADMLT
jgi:hypothetical protein